MGFNTTVLVGNDALSALPEDATFGKKLHDAILHYSIAGKRVDVVVGSYANYVAVIESHADQLVPVLMGGNHGVPIRDLCLSYASEDPELELLRELARKHGYSLRKK